MAGTATKDERANGGRRLAQHTAGARRTVIAPSVVATVAGVAARGVSGVHDLRAPSGGGVLSRIRPSAGDDPADGVQVELGQVQAAFDLTMVAEHGVRVAQLAGDVRERVIDAVEHLTGFEVTEVNIAVVDVYLDEQDEQDDR